MGVPVIGSRTSGIKYILENYQDFLFEPGNAKELARKISQLKAKTKQQRKEIGAEFREVCEKNYSISKFILEHEDFYYKLVDL